MACNCGATPSCGTSYTTCDLADALKCIGGISLGKWKTQFFYLTVPTSSVTVTLGTLPTDPSKIRVFWNGARQTNGIIVGSGMAWAVSGNVIMFTVADLPSGVGTPEAPHGIHVDWEEAETVEDYVKRECPDSAVLFN